MPFIRNGYLCTGHDNLHVGSYKKNDNGISSFLVKCSSNGSCGVVSIGSSCNLIFPKEYIGKKIRIKIQKEEEIVF